MKTAPAVLRTVFQSRFSLIWLLLAMVIGFSLSSQAFRTPDNLLEILQSSGITAILVLGLTWIVAIGEMDISFADVAALVSMITAFLAVKRHLPIGLALLLAFLGGSLIGMLNGFMTAYMKIPSLIGTIATGYAAKAVAKILGGGKPLPIESGGSRIVYGFVFGEVFGIPILFIVTLAIYFFCRFLQDQTAMGQHLYALGENRQAAREAGIKEPRIIFFYFILCSVLASIAGILSTALLGSGVSEIGGGTLTIQGFTAVFLGVMVVKAGKPNVIGTLIGVIMLTVLMNWITLLGLRTFIVWLARGSLLLIGVLIVTLASYRKKEYRIQIR
jgi:ribose transport system permease protein